MINWQFQGTASFVFILLHSPSAIRHAFYETFLHFHIAAVSLAVAAVWIHLKELPQLRIMYGVVSLWVFEVSKNVLLAEHQLIVKPANLPSHPDHYA